MPHRIIAETTSIILEDFEAASAGGPRPFILGLAGAQGSGKTTLAGRLVERLIATGRTAASVSLDDFYFGRARRILIAAEIHPLYATRGPPGTHDTRDAMAFLSAVKSGAAAIAPAFDKGADERLREEEGRRLPADLDVLVFEGWCLGAAPQPPEMLICPMNMLEESFDGDGAWRRAVNKALAGVYQDLFDGIDRLVYLRPPKFEIVHRWRTEQEHALVAAPHFRPRPGLMTAEEISFFIQYFERITRWMMEVTPSHADLTLRLDQRRRVIRAR